MTYNLQIFIKKRDMFANSLYKSLLRTFSQLMYDVAGKAQ